MTFNPLKPHKLPKLPTQNNFHDSGLLTMVINARSQLGELKGYSTSLPNPLLLLSPAIVKESLASSEIENINTTIINVMENQLFTEEEMKEPDKEVLRYRDAILWGYEQLSKWHISTRLILGVQKKLFPSLPKGYRQQQNAIENKNINKIVYTPPVQADISEYISNLENYINDDKIKVDPLIKAIISHYQFEAIHPFCDGNGRTGRIMMVLQLIQEDILTFPILYISGYINAHKNKYYETLLNVTARNNWDNYIKFMLTGFINQARETKEMIFKIMNLFYKTKEEVKKNRKKLYSGDLIEAIFSYPIITPMKLSDELGCHYVTASKYLSQLEQMQIMNSKKIGRYHLFANKRLIAILHQ